MTLAARRAPHSGSDEDARDNPRCRMQSLSGRPASPRRAARLHGLAPRRSPSPAGRGWPASRFDALLGFCLFRVSRRPALGLLSPACLLSWVSGAPTLPPLRAATTSSVSRPSRVSLGPEADAPALAGTSPLLRFPTSSPFSEIRRPHRAWLMGSPRIPVRVAASWRSSSARSGPLPEPPERGCRL